MKPFIASLVPVLVAILLSSVTTFGVTRIVYQSRLASQEANHQRTLTTLSDHARLAMEHTLEQVELAQAKAQQLDNDYQRRLADAHKSAQRIRDDLLLERRRVQFARAELATCQLTQSNPPPTGGVGDVATIRLSREAQFLVHDIRTGIEQDRAKITYLQHYLNDVVNQCKGEK